ncbi:DUF4372 domain-containing protein, partial [Patescibacteria group bacterium]|nr:DUF4372 domain-containing protein [Patescibacteria group bacterium]MBU2250413.1 DUF4372 domain-containing protein [Patescibacteria group bacterium]
DQFLALAFGQLTNLRSLRGIVLCLNAHSDLLYHLGFKSNKFTLTTLILLVAIMKKKLIIKRNLYEILQILSVSQFEKTPVNIMLSETELQNFNEHPLKQPSLFNF